jgi:hypothetical protein
MIASAMSPEEWTEALSWPHGVKDYIVGPADRVGYGDDSCADMARLIALANAALPDTDPRKITRAMVERLYGLANVLRDVHRMNIDAEQCESLADALASYLPPREGTP